MAARRVHVVRECRHPRADHQHGTVQAYTRDGCRCDPCYTAKSKQEEDVRKQKAYGRREPRLVPPDEARRHLIWLQAQGMGLMAVAELCGRDWTTLQRIRSGKSAFLQKATAEGILAVQPDPDANGMVPGIGTQRRIHALMALGYPMTWQARQIRVNRDGLGYVSREGAPLRRRTALALAELYRRIGDTPAPESIRQCERTRARRQAKAGGWLPPAMLDDDSIDDPDYTPGAPDSPAPRGAAAVEEVEFLHSLGVPPLGIASRVGMTNASLARALYRYGRPDLAKWVGDPRSSHHR